MLQNRVTYDTYFQYYLFNKDADHLILATGLALWLLLAIKEMKIKCIMCGVLGTLIVVYAFGHYETIGDILALISVPLILLILIFRRLLHHTAQSKVTSPSIKLTIYYISLIGIIISILSIAITLANLFPLPYGIGAIRNFAYELFALLSTYSYFLIFLISFSFPIRMLIKIAVGCSLLQKIRRISDYSAIIFNSDKLSAKYIDIQTSSKAIYILLFMLLSISLAIIPHISTINKDASNVGVDTQFYSGWINSLDHSKNANDLLYKVFIVEGQNGDRPLTLLLLLAIVKFAASLSISNISLILDFIPVILGPALVLTVYFLSCELTSSSRISLLASFLTSVSFQTLVGIYAGSYANWLALVIGYMSFVFLFRYVKSGSKINFVVFSSLILVLLFVHNYTWTVITAVIVIFLIVSIKLNYYNKKNVYLVLILILFSVCIDLSKMTITHSSSGIGEDLYIAVGRSELTLSQFSFRWDNLKDTMQQWYGGQLSNIVILALCFYWTITNRLNKPYNSFLMIFLSLGMLPLFFGDHLLQGRMIYDIPFQIPSAIALYTLTVDGINKRLLSTLPLLSTIPLLFLCIWIISVSIRAVSNFYLVLPK